MAATNKQFQSVYDYRDAFTCNPGYTLINDPANVNKYTFANALLVLATGTVSFYTPASIASGTPVAVTLTSVPVGTIIKIAVGEVLAGSVAALIR
jgi:hypothetical protein